MVLKIPQNLVTMNRNYFIFVIQFLTRNLKFDE
jgi:hypothetical protein